MSQTVQGPVLETPASADRIVTSSRVRAWWLVNFKGYTYQSRSKVPRVGHFGRILYSSKWTLGLPGEK